MKGFLSSPLHSHEYVFVFHSSFFPEKWSTKSAMKRDWMFLTLLEILLRYFMNALVSTIVDWYIWSCSSEALSLLYPSNCSSLNWQKNVELQLSFGCFERLQQTLVYFSHYEHLLRMEDRHLVPMHHLHRFCVAIAVGCFVERTKCCSSLSPTNSVLLLGFKCSVMNSFQTQLLSINFASQTGSFAWPKMWFCISPNGFNNELISSPFSTCIIQLKRWSILKCIYPIRRNPILTSSK
jgi:hypothetical protein